MYECLRYSQLRDTRSKRVDDGRQLGSSVCLESGAALLQSGSQGVDRLESGVHPRSDGRQVGGEGGGRTADAGVGRRSVRVVARHTQHEGRHAVRSSPLLELLADSPRFRQFRRYLTLQPVGACQPRQSLCKQIAVNTSTLFKKDICYSDNKLVSGMQSCLFADNIIKKTLKFQ